MSDNTVSVVNQDTGAVAVTTDTPTAIATGETTVPVRNYSDPYVTEPNPFVSDKFFEHNQASASSTWTITHNLAKFPSVTVVDSAGNYLIGEVRYLSQNVAEVRFTFPFAGKAYLN